MRLFDLHSHTARCNHANGRVKDYVERAKALGLSHFGVSDHCPWMLQNREIPMAMRWDELPGYVSEVQRLRERDERHGEDSFQVLLGLEMDFIPSRLDCAREIMKNYEWDYLIGSVHNIGFWGLSDPEDCPAYNWRHPEEICEFYYELVERMVRERFCDVIGHLDMPKKYGIRPREGLMPWIEPLIAGIKAAGMAVEINTSGQDALCHEIMPSWEIIEALAAGGVMLTLGSDAHAPNQVGRYLAEVVTGLERLGVKELVRFEKREPIAVPL